MSNKVNVHEAKTHLSKLLDQAMAGEEVVTTRSGQPLVKLTPIQPAPFQRKLGTATGDFIVPDDFDNPLPDSILNDFEK